MSDKEYTVWSCKIGVEGVEELPWGCDFPMRQAIKEAFQKILGKDAEFCFSGWVAELTDAEKSVVEKK